MKIQATKTMAKMLNQAAKNNYCIEKIYFSELPPDAYYVQIRSYYYASDVDYNPKKGKYSFLVVEYKPECYAMDSYITTADMSDIFKKYKPEYAEDLAKYIIQEYEI
jgi:hypothetical protein